jgi:hypothetical protein
MEAYTIERWYDVVVAPPAESDATAPVLLVENAGTVSREIYVNDRDMPDIATGVATDVKVPTLPVDDTGTVSNDPVADEDVPGGTANVSTDLTPTA